MTTSGTGYEATTARMCLRAGLPVLVAWLFVTLTFLLPRINSTGPPYLELNSAFSQFMYGITRSGGRYGTAIVALSFLSVIVARGGIDRKRRWKETCIIVLVGAILGGGVAVLNEYVVKEQLVVPRPNIIFLAGENGSGPLEMTAEEFYGSGTRETRRELLASALKGVPESVPLSSRIKSLWMKETGYSFPSGHSFSAMFFTTFLLSLAVTYLAANRYRWFYLLLPWAVAVCYSRTILRVHTPADITVGGLLGIAVGIAAWALARFLIRWIIKEGD